MRASFLCWTTLWSVFATSLCAVGPAKTELAGAAAGGAAGTSGGAAAAAPAEELGIITIAGKKIVRCAEYCELDRRELDAWPEGLEKLETLKILSLKDNKLNRLPGTLCNLKRLDYLFISGNPLSALHVPTVHSTNNGCWMGADNTHITALRLPSLAPDRCCLTHLNKTPLATRLNALQTANREAFNAQLAAIGCSWALNILTLRGMQAVGAAAAAGGNEGVDGRIVLGDLSAEDTPPGYIVAPFEDPAGQPVLEDEKGPLIGKLVTFAKPVRHTYAKKKGPTDPADPS